MKECPSGSFPLLPYVELRQISAWHSGELVALFCYPPFILSMPVFALFLTISCLVSSASAQSLSAEPERLDLGSTKKSVSASTELTLGNLTEAELEIELSVTEETFATDTDSFSLAVGEARVVPISFQATAAGMYEGALRIVVKKLFTSEEYTVLLRAQVVEPNLSFLPAPEKTIEFGAVRVGQQVRRTVLVENPSAVSVTIDSFYLGAGAGAFRLGELLDPELKPGGLLDLIVEFEPKKGGVVATTLVLVATDNATPRLEFGLRAEGQAPVARYSPLPEVGLEFGTAIVGSRQLRRATILNSGSAELVVSTAAVSGGGFTAMWNQDSLGSLLPGERLTLDVAFEPLITGTFTGKLALTTNDPLASVMEIPIKGVARTSPAAIEILNNRRIDFGSAGLGKQQKENLLLWNQGGAPFTVKTHLEGRAAAEFTIESPSVLLQPGASAAIEIIFTPRELGSRSAEMVVKTASGDHRLALQGEGRFLKLTPSTVDFGRIAVGETNSQVVEILNIGNVDFTVDQVESTGDAFAVYTQVNESNKFILPANGLRSLPLNIAFSPPRRGAVTETLRLQGFWEDGTETLDVLLNGTGVAAEIELHPSGPLEFGYVELGKSETRTIVATNSGDSESWIEARSLTPEVRAEPNTFTLRPGESTKLAVLFTPQVLGNRLGKILLISNDLKEKARPISIRGKGALGSIDLAEVTTVSAIRKSTLDMLDLEWNNTPLIVRDASKIEVGFVVDDSLRRTMVGRKINVEWVKLDENYDPKGSAKRAELQIYEASAGTVVAEGFNLRLEENGTKRARVRISTSSYPGAPQQFVSQVLEVGGWRWEFEAKPLVSFLTVRPGKDYKDKKGNKVNGETERLIGLPGLAFAGWHNPENPSVSGVHLTAIGNVLEALSTNNSIAVSLGLALSLYKDRFLFGFGWDVYDSRPRDKRKGTQDYIMTFKYSALF